MKQITFLFALIISGSLFAQFPYLQWNKNAGGSNGIGGSKSVVVDGLGNTYTTGFFSGTVQFSPSITRTAVAFQDIFLAKFDTSGAVAWVVTIGSAGNDAGRDITLDRSGNIVICGLIGGTADFNPNGTTIIGTGAVEGYVARYSPSGDLIKAFYIPGNGMGARGVDVDVNNDILVTGGFYGPQDFDVNNTSSANSIVNSVSGLGDIYLAKYTIDGAYQWAFSLGTSQDFEEGVDVVSDLQGGIYLTGTYRAGNMDMDPSSGVALAVGQFQASNMFVAHYTSVGGYVSGAAFSGFMIPNQLVYSFQSGTVYVCGSFNGAQDFNPDPVQVNLVSNNGDEDAFIVALYQTSLTYLSAKGYGQADADRAYSMAIDPLGNVLMCGMFYGDMNFLPAAYLQSTNGTYEGYIATLDPSLNPISAYMLDGPGGLDICTGIATNGTRFAVTGTFQGALDFDFSPASATLTPIGNAQNSFTALYRSVNCPIQYTNDTIVSCGPYTTIDNQMYFTSGTYYSNMMSPNTMCDSIVTRHVTIYVSNDTLMLAGNTLTALQSGAQYQWFDCVTGLPIPGETGQSFTATTNGTYAAIITNGTCVDTSECYPIVSTVVNALPSAFETSLMPNPANDQVRVEVNYTTQVTIFNELGQVVFTQQINAGAHQLILHELPVGMYSVMMTSDAGVRTQKLMIVR